MLWSDTFFPTQIHFNLSTQYWDKVLYPKDLFVLRVSIKNSGSNTLWYPSILILIIDSSDLVRGKHFIQLWSADDSIKPGVSKEYILYFHVPDDMKAQNFFAEAVLYGKIEYSCPQITMYNQLLMLENKIYGTIPEDPNRNWLLAETNGFFHSYPPCVPYVFQVISIATNTLFTAILVIMVRTSEKTKKALSAYIPFITIPIFMAILFLIVFLLSHLLF